MRRFFLLLICMLLLSGCAVTAAPADAGNTEREATAVTFTDDLGRSVTVTEPRRVAVLIGSFADIWCLAGGSETLVATANDAWTSFAGLPLEGVTNLGSTMDISLELLLAAEPDFILASGNTPIDLELEPTLTELGIPTAYFQVSNFQDYLRLLDVCTRITGARQAYETYGTSLETQIRNAVARADGSSPKVLCIRASSAGCKVKNSQGSVLGQMLQELGCVNIADSDTTLLENLSIEAILAQDPDKIFLVYHGPDPSVGEEHFQKSLGSNPAWASLRAVQEGQVYVMDPAMYNLKPNGRWGEAYEHLADILYPAE